MKISKEIKVALLGIAAVVILYFGYEFLKGSSLFSKSNTYYVVYDSVDGLTISNPVFLNGIQVGHVKDMELLTDRANMVRVDIEVRKDLQVGDSTIASLGNSDLLGSKAITLHLNNSRKQYKGGEELIAFKETSIGDMLSSKSVPVIDKVDTTLARVNRLLDSEAKDNIQSILANSNRTTEMVNAILRENQRNINQITGNLSQLTAALRQTQRNIDRLTLNMAEITDTLKQVEINKLVRDANSAVNELETTISKLNSNQGSLGKLMNDEELYRNMNRSTEALNLLLRDIQAYPKRYVQFSLIGRKDKYKVDATGRVITLEEVKELQDENPDEFRRPAPDSVKVVPADTTKRQ
ncbi:MlaD family protein [Pontibacter ramchanderi]|uniref:Phospholipid/cholesterol/gamma-HCH transport system substrate-binding protein n=1 Tax=Pontibacter ramchanderi TaxID=1179743 RepID=A0A2N3UAY5_9BACT|nr:MlaD family protein [Pontibacter ramchanderi]PKV66538.1 phospholipid/cholesterol/gamma-HCH transport system substrate-binding protein [Pontibacter ramchanderi]